MSKLRVIAVVGPTATGKSALAIRLAQKYNGEIISADSMQIYRGLDICTAKPSAVELSSAPHRLIGIIPPERAFSVADYVPLARLAVDETARSGRLPIICGGTGLYVDRLLSGTSLSAAEGDAEYRASLAEYSNEELYGRLAETDPAAAVATHPNNRKRVIRALEIFHATGMRKSELDARSAVEADPPYDAEYIGLTARREFLYTRIDARVDKMIADGLVEEVESAYRSQNGGVTFAQAIGYKELIEYFEGRTSLDFAIAAIKQATRNYAKRQLTWFCRNPKIKWYDVEKGEERMLWT